MAETVEYALVVLVSTLFVAGSVATYASFSSLESELRFRQEYQAISTLVSSALVNGSSRASLSLPESRVACDPGRITVTAGSMNRSIYTGFPCSFEVNISQGLHVLTFAVRSSHLTLAVS